MFVGECSIQVLTTGDAAVSATGMAEVFARFGVALMLSGSGPAIAQASKAQDDLVAAGAITSDQAEENKKASVAGLQTIADRIAAASLVAAEETVVYLATYPKAYLASNVIGSLLPLV